MKRVGIIVKNIFWTRLASFFRLHDAFVDGIAYKVCHIVDVQFLHNVRAMGINRPRADKKFLGNLLICQPVRDEYKNFFFPLREDIVVGKREDCLPLRFSNEGIDDKF